MTDLSDFEAMMLGTDLTDVRIRKAMHRNRRSKKAQRRVDKVRNYLASVLGWQ